MRSIPKKLNVFFAAIFASIACVNGAFAGFNDLPHLSSDSSGNIVSIWQAFDADGNYFIMSARKSAGQSWGTPTQISTSGHYATSPYVLVDASGNAFAIWSEIDSITQNSVIYGAIYTSGDSWATAALLSDTSTGALNDYTLVLNEAGGVDITWSAFDNTYSSLDIYYVSGTVGGGFTTAENISN